jgi:hypothetical protein
MVRVTFLLRLALLGMSVSTCLATSSSAADEADDVKRAMDSPLFAEEQQPIDLPITSPVSDLIASAMDRLILSQDTHFKSQDTHAAEVLQVLHAVNDKQEKRSGMSQFQKCLCNKLMWRWSSSSAARRHRAEDLRHHAQDLRHHPENVRPAREEAESHFTSP